MKLRSLQNHVINSLLVVSLLLLGACGSAPKHAAEFAPVRPALPIQHSSVSGVIYQAGNDLRLFEDVKARRIGDILNVILDEETEASKDASTNLEKDNTTVIDNPTIFGTAPEFDVPGFFPLANTSDVNLGTNLSSSHEFEGSGDSSQNNELEGNISVTVAEVLPNGNLVVRGEKRITLNQGNEYIRISGIVRSIDILSNNTVLSTQIADATIMYTGDGAIEDSNGIGWLARFFMGVIFPF